VALGLGCVLMGSCLASFLAPSARLARCSKQPTAWLHQYAKKWRSILVWLSGALAGSPGPFLLLPSATIEPPRATASALASPWLGRGGSPPPEPADRAAPGRRGGSPALPLAGPSPNLVVTASSVAATTASRAGYGWLWQPAQENTVLSPKTDPLWSLSNSKVSPCRWLPG
jgi:hypothetical protein